MASFDALGAAKSLMEDRYDRFFSGMNLRAMAEQVFGADVVSEEALAQIRAVLPLRRVSSGFVASQVSRAFAKTGLEDRSRKKKEFIVRQPLTSEQQSRLVNEWGTFRGLKFQPNGLRACHGVASTVRKLELLKLQDAVSLGRDVRVKLVGENSLAAASHFAGVVGVVAPNLSVRDVLTRNTRVSSSQIAILGRSGRLSESEVNRLSSPGVIRRVKAEDDLVHAHVLVGRQVYMNKISMAQACDAAQALEFIGTVIIPSDLMTRLRAEKESVTELESVGGYYRLRKEAGKWNIYFDFGDFCQGYVHDFEDYAQLSQPSVVHTPQASYAYEITARHGDVVFFRMSLLPSSVTRFSVPRHVEVYSGPKQLAVKSWRYVSGMSRLAEAAFEPINLVVEADVFNRVVNMFLTIETKFSLQEGVRMLRALNSSSVVYGDSIGATTAVRAVDMFPLSAAAALRALYIKTRGQYDLKQHLKDLESIRSLAGKVMALPFRLLVEAIKTSYTNFVRNKSVRALFSACGLLNVYDLWSSVFFNPSRKEVTVEVIDSIRWLDESHPETLSALVTIPTVQYSDRKYDGERLVIRDPWDHEDESTSDDLTLLEQRFISEVRQEPQPSLNEQEKVQYINESIKEAAKINEREILDCEKSTQTAFLIAYARPGVISVSDIERTWGGSTSRPMEVIAIRARNGQVQNIVPSFAKVDHMFVASRGKYSSEARIKLGRPLQIGDSFEDGDYVTWSGLKVFVADKRREAFEKAAVVTDASEFVVTGLTGVHGGGKTRKLVEQIMEDHIVLSSTNRGKEELQEACKAQGKKIKLEQVRTLDSYLMMEEQFESSYLIQDECYQQHFGFLALAAVLASGNTGKISVQAVYCGDKVQVPFINRSKLLLRYYEIPDFIFHSISFVSASFRSPVDVVCVNAQDYRTISDEKVTTYSEVERSLFVKPWAGVQSVPRYTDPKTQQYITMTHKEQGELVVQLRSLGLNVGKKADIDKGIVGVNVPGEIQGMTAREATIVRQYDTTHIAYQNSGPNLVAVSRHTHICTYVTIAPSALNDKLLDKFKIASSLLSESLDEHKNSLAGYRPHEVGECGNCGFFS